MEYGQINLNHKWKKVNLSNTFTNPIVIASDPTFRGRHAASIRLRNIQSTSFQIKLAEPNYLDGRHTNEKITYLVGEKGNWKIGTNCYIEFDNFNSDKLSSKGFNTINFNSAFSEIPNIFTTVQTFSGKDWVVTRTRNIGLTRFRFAMQEEERLNRGRHVTEKIGYLALSKGEFTIDGKIIECKSVGGVNHRNKKINYASSFSSTPFLISKLSSFSGGDTANTRIINNNSGSFTVKVYEEQSRDREIRHINETISYLAIL